MTTAQVSATSSSPVNGELAQIFVSIKFKSIIPVPFKQVMNMIKIGNGIFLKLSTEPSLALYEN